MIYLYRRQKDNKWIVRCPECNGRCCHLTNSTLVPPMKCATCYGKGMISVDNEPSSHDTIHRLEDL